MARIVDLHKGRDGVYRENVTLGDQIEQDQVTRSRNWGRSNHSTSLKDIVLTGDEKHMHDMYDAMSMCDQ